jgi:hypothetical protein
MKHRTLWNRGLGVNTSILIVAAFAIKASAEPLPPANTTELKATVDESSPAEAPPADTDAPARLVSPEKPIPVNIRPSSPVAEVIKLANSGLDQTVMLAFVTNSTHTFNLGAEEIIYLNDIGVPGAVVTAMIQRDQTLKTELAAAASNPAEQNQAGPPVPGEAPPMEPGGPETTPPVDNPGYAVEAPLTPPDAGTDDMFYDSLAPYGSWVDVAGYGRCWQPTAVVVNSGWQPYFDCGHWVYSDCGWYWASDYSWGWAPFHYGNWFRHARLGWCWVPGRTWGPSWVSWRYGDNYCGWAPLPPGCSFAAGIGLTFRGHHVRDDEDFGLRPGHYRFIAWNHFHDRELRPGGLPRQENDRAFARTTVATRISGDSQTVINNGLPVSRVAAATHRPVQTVMLQDSTAPGRGRAERFEAGSHTLQVYRPDPAVASRSSSRNQGVVSRPASERSTQVSVAGSAWAPSASAATPGMRGGTTRTPPLVLRGPQSSARRESVPASSLVVIGRGANSAASALPARPAASAPSAMEPVPSADNRPATAAQNPQRNWMGTVGSSPRPAWFANTENSAANRFNGAVAAPRPEVRSYEPVQRAPAQVPRYSPAPRSYTPSYSAPSYSAPARSYSPPPSAAPSRASSFESRPAQSAPSAPSAPAASSRGSSSGSSGRSGR